MVFIWVILTANNMFQKGVAIACTHIWGRKNRVDYSKWGLLKRRKMNCREDCFLSNITVEGDHRQLFLGWYRCEQGHGGMITRSWTFGLLFAFSESWFGKSEANRLGKRGAISLWLRWRSHAPLSLWMVQKTVRYTKKGMNRKLTFYCFLNPSYKLISVIYTS